MLDPKLETDGRTEARALRVGISYSPQDPAQKIIKAREDGSVTTDEERRDGPRASREHCKMAREFHQVKHDIAMLEDRKRKLLAELVEDDKVAMEIARLEEEFNLLTEENRNLASVHTERAQQLESLWQTTKPEDS
ncbi:unnamed protein product [Merluccius merluccius]